MLKPLQHCTARKRLIRREVGISFKVKISKCYDNTSLLNWPTFFDVATIIHNNNNNSNNK